MIRALLLCTCLGGCVSLRPNADEWTTQERIAFAASIAGHSVDLASSL